MTLRGDPSPPLPESPITFCSRELLEPPLTRALTGSRDSRRGHATPGRRLMPHRPGLRQMVSAGRAAPSGRESSHMGVMLDGTPLPGDGPTQQRGHHSMSPRAIHPVMPDQVVREVTRGDTAESSDPTAKPATVGPLMISPVEQ
jgi:hypothetical protein